MIRSVWYLMKRALRAVRNQCLVCWSVVAYIRNLMSFKVSARNKGVFIEDIRIRPIFGDRVFSVGFDRHYLLHTAWAARKLRDLKVDHHTDFSSCLRFVSLLSAFLPASHFDFRKVDIQLTGLETGSADLLSLGVFRDEAIQSVSCMHVIEHIGLGRYGDPINADGDKLAAASLTRILAPGGFF